MSKWFLITKNMNPEPFLILKFILKDFITGVCHRSSSLVLRLDRNCFKTCPGYVALLTHNPKPKLKFSCGPGCVLNEGHKSVMKYTARLGLDVAVWSRGMIRSRPWYGDFCKGNTLHNLLIFFDIYTEKFGRTARTIRRSVVLNTQRAARPHFSRTALPIRENHCSKPKTLGPAVLSQALSSVWGDQFLNFRVDVTLN